MLKSHFFYTLFLFFLYSKVWSQDINQTMVAEKAKLLTISRFGIANKDSIWSDLQKQKLWFIPNKSTNILLMKVRFEQKYRHGNNQSTLWIGGCFFYIAYNKKTFKYYRLGGWDTVDAFDFFNDLPPEDYSRLLLDEKLKENIDFYCLLEYSKWPRKRKKQKKTCPCSKICSEELETILRID